MKPLVGTAAGTVLGNESDLTVACGTGALNLLKLQRAGKTPMDVKTFLRGFPIDARR